MIAGQDAARHPSRSKAKSNDASKLPGLRVICRLCAHLQRHPPGHVHLPMGTSDARWPLSKKGHRPLPGASVLRARQQLLAGGVSRLWRRACGQTLPSRRPCLARQRNGRVRSCRDLQSTICQPASAENTRFRTGVNRHSERILYTNVHQLGCISNHHLRLGGFTSRKRDLKIIPG